MLDLKSRGIVFIYARKEGGRDGFHGLCPRHGLQKTLGFIPTSKEPSTFTSGPVPSLLNVHGIATVLEASGEGEESKEIGKTKKHVLDSVQTCKR